jgi:hypothetical protein
MLIISNTSKLFLSLSRSLDMQISAIQIVNEPVHVVKLHARATTFIQLQLYLAQHY